MSNANNEQRLEPAHVLGDDHSEIHALIHELLTALDQENTAQSFELLDLLWARLAVHIRAEHHCLFPSILDASPHNFTGSSGTPKYDEAKSAIDSLRHDHDFFMHELGIAVNRMRKKETRSDHDLASKILRDVRSSVVKVQSRLDTHNRLEENHIYKWVNVLLDETKRLTLMASIRQELENIPPRLSLFSGKRSV